MQTPSSDICTLTLRYKQQQLILFLTPSLSEGRTVPACDHQLRPQAASTCASQTQQTGKASKMAGKDD